jgi:hypothetical protein
MCAMKVPMPRRRGEPWVVAMMRSGSRVDTATRPQVPNSTLCSDDTAVWSEEPFWIATPEGHLEEKSGERKKKEKKKKKKNGSFGKHEIPSSCAMTSVSVWLLNVTPSSRSSFFFISSALSMTPLCTTETTSHMSWCGCALTSVLPPCVAHLVCAMPWRDERERERERETLSEDRRREKKRERKSVCVCVCERERERERTDAGIAVETRGLS